ncbi:MAG: immune inhibitor A domain-containing protein [Bacillota bacterium]
MRRALAFLVLAAFVAAIAMGAAPGTTVRAQFSQGSQAAAVSELKGIMPPNEDKIARTLMERGLIPAGATPDQVDQAVRNYLTKKLATPTSERPSSARLAKKAAAARERLLSNGEIRRLTPGKRLGKPVTSVDPVNPRRLPLQRTDKILVLLAEFSGDPLQAPEHGYLPRPNNNADFWTSDTSPEYFQKMLFTPGGIDTPEGLHLDSMTDYFLEQSNGLYTVEGQVFGWYKVSQPEAYYGDDNPEGGHDNLQPGTAKDLVRETVQAAVDAGVPLEDFDKQDPYDLDGDGDYDEPDGIVDHLMIVHAGDDQSGGGGLQGDNALWAHSSATLVRPTGTTMWTYDYTMMPENGTLGVFAHEFTHDLGLPDEYDTIYSGNGDTVGFWSIMSSGSWTGKPLGTRPPSMSPWGRWILGWVEPTSVNLADLNRDGTYFVLDESNSLGDNNQVLKINLPPKLLYVNTPYSGTYEWFGGKDDEMDSRLFRSVDLTGKTSAMLSYAAWYDIEEAWDFGFVQVSTDGGATWTPLVTPRMTSEHDPDAMDTIVANLPGYTGNSGGWVTESIDLSAYAAQQILLQFRYMTDWGTTMAGFMVDDIRVTADGQDVFFDDVESMDSAWTADGWTRFKGQDFKSHYYMAEWRSLHGFDSALENVYNFRSDATNVDYFPYQPGLLLWYRDTSYTDNWVGVHPGHGFLSVVDAHPTPMIEPVGGSAWRTRVQVYDATFGLDRVDDITLDRYDATRTYQGKSAVPHYADNWNYWFIKAPHAGVQVPDYGLNIHVAGTAPDNSAALIGVYTDK